MLKAKLNLTLALFRWAFLGLLTGGGGGQKGSPSIKSVTHILQ